MLSNGMPLLAKQAGVWEGVYRYYDQQGILIDEHASRLTCTIVDDRNYHQINEYTWSGGKKEVREFPAKYSNGRIWFDNDLIKGYAAQDQLDPYKRTMLLYWVRKEDTECYFYEMIQVDDECKTRTRTWHCFRKGILEKRVCIGEVKI
jgi:hypothetical protein